MAWSNHFCRVGSLSISEDTLPTVPEELDAFVASARKRIEPWLSAVFQAEHLNLFAGSGLTTAVASIAGVPAAGMSKVKLGTSYDDAIEADAEASAKAMNRGELTLRISFAAHSQSSTV